MDKRYFPSGYTKRDLLDYYTKVAPFLLPHLKDRPVTLIRFPEGVTGESFYEKNAPAHTPDWMQTIEVPRRHREGHIRYLVIDRVEALLWCANLGAIELHPFLHRKNALDRPTAVAFDLDPGEGADLLTCVDVAFLVKALLDALDLAAFPKVSGSKGLQIYVPLNTPVTYEQTSAFAKAVAQYLEQAHPQKVVSSMSKALRKGRVMIDWSQNSPSKTTVAVYSVRGKRDEPFVSMPVTWAELRSARRRQSVARLQFSPGAAQKRLAKIGDLFAPVLTLKQTLPRAFSKLTANAVASPDEENRRVSVGAALAPYAAKRDFSKTREPAPSWRPAKKKGRDGRLSGGETKAGSAASGAAAGRFVIQKHAASRLHYDFRLEHGGTLKSWAVPKGPPYGLGIKRAAFEVEDHPVSYIDFEGTIPRGQYGGGTVMVWDRGTYELIGGSWAQHDLKLRLHGEKLKGEWHLFRIRTEESKPVWLLIKAGRATRPISARRDDTSVLSGRSMAKIAKDNDAQWNSRQR